MQINIFGTPEIKIPKTEGIKYTGSKLKLLPYIIDAVKDLPICSILDGFAGTTRVSQAFAKLGYQTTANDSSIWTKIFAETYLFSRPETAYYQELLNYLNNLKGEDGWFSLHYGGKGDERAKKPFQLHNTQKLDAIRIEIDKLGLPEADKSVLLTSLILALDKVDNTLGHYVAYLANWSPRSYQTIELKLPLLNTFEQENKAYCADIFQTVQTNSFDLAYLDPPYGSNNEKMPPSRVRYAAYYHIWKTVILNDQPMLFGKANRRIDSKDGVAASIFEEFRKDTNDRFIAIQAIETLINTVQAKYILLSYSSGGRATKNDLLQMITNVGKLKHIYQLDYKKNVIAQMTWTQRWASEEEAHYEYLFLFEKD